MPKATERPSIWALLNVTIFRARIMGRDATLCHFRVRRENRRLEFELGAGFEDACGLALVLALSQMREHGLGSFDRADLHPRRNPIDRQGRFAPQPGGNSLKKRPVDLQPLITIQRKNLLVRGRRRA
jgi:hypothetical protein